MSTGKADQLAWLIFLLDKKGEFYSVLFSTKNENTRKAVENFEGKTLTPRKVSYTRCQKIYTTACLASH
jgi:hypothetical protein